MPTDLLSDKTFSFSPIWLWIGVSLSLVILTQLIGFNGLYGQDSHEYLRFSRYLQGVFAGVEKGPTFFYPIGYPLFGSMLGFVFSNIFALQLLSMLSLAICAYGLYGILNRVFPDVNDHHKISFISLLFVLSPFMLRASVVVMSDLFALMWVLLALRHFLEYRESSSLKAVTIFGLATGLAIITRYATALILLLPAIVLVYHMIARRKYVHFPLFIFLLLIGPATQYYIKGVDAYGLLDHPLFLEWEFENMFRSDFDAHEGVLEYPFINLLYPLSVLFHPGFFVLFLPLLFFLKFRDLRRPKVLFLLAVFVIYALFLAGIPFQNVRFLYLAFPLILPAFYPAFDRSMKWVKSRTFLNATLIIIAIILLQLALSTRAIYPFWEMNQMEQKLVQTVNELNPDRKLYTFGWDVALKSYDVRIQMVNLRNEEISKAEAGDYVFFSEEQLKSQWEGRAVMKNYSLLKDRFELTERKQFNNHWTLYELR